MQRLGRISADADAPAPVAREITPPKDALQAAIDYVRAFASSPGIDVPQVGRATGGPGLRCASLVFMSATLRTRWLCGVVHFLFGFADQFREGSVSAPASERGR